MNRVVSSMVRFQRCVPRYRFSKLDDKEKGDEHIYFNKQDCKCAVSHLRITNEEACQEDGEDE